MNEPITEAHYRHEALLYRGLADFVRQTAPFIRGGLEAGEPVLVVTGVPGIAALHAELGGDAERVRFADMAEVGANPARIIPFWQEFIDSEGAAGRPLRGIGEPICAGRGAAEMVECQRHESLLNVAIDPTTPMWLLCPYDTTGLDSAVIEEARRSHPFVTEGTHRRDSRSFRGVDASGAPFAVPLPEPPSRGQTLAFGSGDLGAVRDMVAGRAAEAGLNASRVQDLVVAAHEIAANSVRHGGGRGVLRAWRDNGSLICEFSDPGRFDDPLVDRTRPPPDAAGSRGLWLANQLCDLVQIRTLSSGTVVRVHMRLPS
ncbi:MAG TPA: sensor histidine kinase [Candidatus Nitrosopolaris sp.]|nr:sensor histidine kinase [Candidatus Nitrosopolaris sp.]